MSKENRRETGTYNLEIDGGRRRFLSSAGIATGGLLASGLSVPGSANAKVSIDYPDETVPAPMRFLGGEYSLAERDLRWEQRVVQEEICKKDMEILKDEETGGCCQKDLPLIEIEFSLAIAILEEAI